MKYRKFIFFCLMILIICSFNRNENFENKKTECLNEKMPLTFDECNLTTEEKKEYYITVARGAFATINQEAAKCLDKGNYYLKNKGCVSEKESERIMEEKFKKNINF